MSELNPKLQEGINAQINNELFSSYSYLSMAAYLEHEQFLGCASWMLAQSKEENEHAMRLYDFMAARHARVILKPIEQPMVDFESVPHVFEMSMKQEQKVTSQIEALCEIAYNERAFAAIVELEWFIKEQVEEEKTIRDIVHKFNLVKDDPSSLLDLDRELGERKPEEGEAE